MMSPALAALPHRHWHESIAGKLQLAFGLITALVPRSGAHDEQHGDLGAALKALWGDNALLRAVSAGDDYQIAFTAPSGLSGPFTRIGQVVAGEGVGLTVAGVEIAVPRPGYRHF